MGLWLGVWMRVRGVGGRCEGREGEVRCCMVVRGWGKGIFIEIRDRLCRCVLGLTGK